MSLKELWKEKITPLLFGPRAEAEADSGALPEQSTGAEAEAEVQAAGPVNQTLLELPSDHALRRLYDLRRREAEIGRASCRERVSWYV